jgi:hypothetical protein
VRVFLFNDHANAVCGVLRQLSNHLGYNTNYEEWVGGSHLTDPYGHRAMLSWRIMQAEMMGGRIL